MGKKVDFISPEKIQECQQTILQFYKENKRDLPWRQTKDPYHILLSEFMLQQTQVSRVIDYYQTWIQTWPTIRSLSHASFQDVLSKWIGLGYNRRAKYLHTTATIIVEEYDGDVLRAMQDYEKLPGIGRYTAQAVRIFAGNEDIATVDTNIRRILIHEFNLPEGISEKELFTIAHLCVPEGKSCIWHNALMDYGSLLLTSRKSGIKPKTRQPKFKGSDRQIRGQILRLLVQEPYQKESIYVSVNSDSRRVDKLLEKMEEEHIITKDGNVYSIHA